MDASKLDTVTINSNRLKDAVDDNNVHKSEESAQDAIKTFQSLSTQQLLENLRRDPSIVDSLRQSLAGSEHGETIEDLFENPANRIMPNNKKTRKARKESMNLLRKFASKPETFQAVWIKGAERSLQIPCESKHRLEVIASKLGSAELKLLHLQDGRVVAYVKGSGANKIIKRQFGISDASMAIVYYDNLEALYPKKK